MKIKLWGVRGSLPCPEVPQALHKRISDLLTEFSKSGVSVEKFMGTRSLPLVGGFGGNTTCVQVKAGNQNLIIDAGSGLKELGGSLLSGLAGKGNAKIHMLFTHFHWDHLIGLPFFVPIFIPGNEIHIYAVQPELEMAIRQMFTRPFFPVDFSSLGAKIHFHSLVPRQKRDIDGFSVTPYGLDHPDPCWGYRIELGGRSFAHCVDTECERNSAKDLGLDLPLYSNADVMLFDAQYTLTEVVDKANWGHSVASFGIDLALAEKIKRVLFMHHDPYATHEKVAAAAHQTAQYYESRVKELSLSGQKTQPVDWSFAVEGMELEI
jgi:phosphoribosyl 1,2-cyclic phosphodiesterase